MQYDRRAPLLLLAVLSATLSCGAPARRSAAGARPGSATPTSPSAVTRLLTALRTGDKRESDEATSALAALRPPVTAAVVVLLADPVWRVRWRGVNTLGYLRDPSAIAPLVERVLADPSPHVRWRSLWAVSSIDPEAGAARAAFAANLDGDDETRRWRAVVGLSFFNDRRCLPHLPTGLLSDDRFVRFEAVYGLQMIHDEATSARLEPLLETEPTPRVRRQVIQTLAAICDRKARELLTAGLTDADSGVRWRSASGLGRCGDPASRAVLAARQAIESDAEVLDEIGNALDTLDHP